MDYFWIRQDRRYENSPVIEDFYEKMQRKNFTPERKHRIPDRNVVYCDTFRKLDFTDIVDGQAFLVSEKIRRVFEIYERQITYKFFCILNNLADEYMTYYAPILPVVDCMVKPGPGRENKLILRESAIDSASIFRVKYDEREIVVVRLDVAESLLRRDVRGVELIRSRIEGEENEPETSGGFCGF